MLLPSPSIVKLSISFLATFLILSQVPSSTSERILVLFPISSKSMVNLFQPLVKSLVERGHEVKAATPIHLQISSENFTQLLPTTGKDPFQDYPEPFEMRRQAKLFSFPIGFQTKYCHQFYQMEEFRKWEREKFDSVIVNVQYHDCFAGFLHKLGSPIIFFGSLPIPSGLTELVGNHLPSSFVPICLLGDISAQLSFVQRTKNFVYNLYFSGMLELWNRPHMEALYREYLGQDIPSVKEIYKNLTSLFLMNSHSHSITSPRPLLPSIVEIGGIHCRPARPLPKDLEEFASGAEHGLIVFSLGSIVKAVNMPESVRQAFVQTFAKLPQRVIWKWEKDEGMPDLPSNVKLVKWLPQQDLLGHPNTSLFITHGGLLSTEEAVYHGQPVIGLPVFIDQDANMRQAEILGFGIKMEILDLTEPKLTPAIRRILDEPRFSQRAKELSKYFRDQPTVPLERAVYWTEYVMRHKGAYHMRSSAMDLNWIQYFSMDVVGFILVALISFIGFVYFISKAIIRLVITVAVSAMMTFPRKNTPKLKIN